MSDTETMEQQPEARTVHPFKSERGQSLVVVAAAAIALIAFVGIVTDVGLVYVQHGHLQRAVDAAAVAAAGQIRAGWTYTDSLSIAMQFIQVHNLDPTDVQVFVPPITEGTSDYYYDVCDNVQTGAWYEDTALCGDPPRKLVRVEAKAKVNLAFLNIIGIHDVTMSAISEGEAATLDVALVLDTSYSMAWDTGHYQNPADPHPDWMWRPTWESDFVAACNQDLLAYFDDDPSTVCTPHFYPDDGNPNAGEMRPCNYLDPECCMPCDPMYKVVEAAQNFVGRLREPFDRVSIVTFDRDGQALMSMGTNMSSALTAVGTLQVYDEPYCLWVEGVSPASGGDPSNYWLCQNTNLGGGLAHGSNQFTDPALRRDESVWVMIVLSDGAANVAKGVTVGVNDFCPDDGCCPDPHKDPPSMGGETPAFCRDQMNATRHCAEADADECHPGGLPGWDPAQWPEGWTADGSTVHYDAEDFARDMADFAALREPHGNSIIIFTIGLGENVTDEPGVVGEADAGEKLLRYLANVGYNGEWNATFTTHSGAEVDWNGGAALDWCANSASRENCGNYYFAPKDINELNEVFAKIASRIFTRITQ
jgi:Flp pilus assembly protein TadG